MFAAAVSPDIFLVTSIERLPRCGLMVLSYAPLLPLSRYTLLQTRDSLIKSKHEMTRHKAAPPILHSIPGAGASREKPHVLVR